MDSYARSLSCLLLGAAWLSGCAALHRGPQPTPEQVGERALAALERGDYAAAFPDLVWVYSRFPDRTVGRHALLALAAAELDPNNPVTRLHEGSRLVAAFLERPENPPWLVPVGRSLHGLALELATTRDRALLAERRLEQAEHGITLAEQAAGAAAARARDAEATAQRERRERESLQRRVSRLENDLAETHRELARARRALGGS